MKDGITLLGKEESFLLKKFSPIGLSRSYQVFTSHRQR
jgi:hypothetical protein